MPKGKSATPALASTDETDAPGLSTDNVLLLIEKITANFTLSLNSCVERIIDAIGKKLSIKLRVTPVRFLTYTKKSRH